MKKIRPNPSGSYYRAETTWLHGPLGRAVSWKEKKQNLNIWWASRRSWIQLHIFIWTSSVNKNSVHHCLHNQAPQDSSLQKANKQKTTTQKGEKNPKDRSWHLRKCLLHALENSHITGVFAFPSNSEPRTASRSLLPAVPAAGPNLHRKSRETHQELIFTCSLLQINTFQFLFKNKHYKGAIDY